MSFLFGFAGSEEFRAARGRMERAGFGPVWEPKWDAMTGPAGVCYDSYEDADGYRWFLQDNWTADGNGKGRRERKGLGRSKLGKRRRTDEECEQM